MSGESSDRQRKTAVGREPSKMNGVSKKGPFLGPKKLNRPDSLRLELINESARSSVVFSEGSDLHLGFRELSYSVRSGIFKTGNVIFEISTF